MDMSGDTDFVGTSMNAGAVVAETTGAGLVVGSEHVGKINRDLH